MWKVSPRGRGWRLTSMAAAVSSPIRFAARFGGTESFVHRYRRLWRGALKGSSIMPGGNADAWEHVKANIFQAIAAKTDKGEPCCQWVARGGAGHFVKMFQNGIEHGDMQMLCETYVERVSPDIGGMKEMLSSNRRRFDYFVAALGFKM